MEILNKAEHVVTQVVYTIQDDTSVFYYKEWIDSSGKVIDSIITSKDGETINEDELTEKVWNLIDNQ